MLRQFGRSFPSPSTRTDQYARHIVNLLDAINGGSGFMVSVGEVENGRLIVALSGERDELENHLERQLRAVPAPYPGFRRSVFEGQSSLHSSMMNSYSGRQYGMTYGGSRNCAEPKIIEMAFILRQRLVAMTTIWYGSTTNRAARKGYHKYMDNRLPLGLPHRLNFALPCEICSQNEARLMLYLEEGFPQRTAPRFGSYEAPF
ncbi:hypothetical protein SAMN05660479_01889 [Microbulbifer thermotolerans]|uniref:hypothetical protein n=1 Tax=Microbulbifer thermotolerans TaxID=252514 RepID=UPI0008F33980|nr:hypothetical protein [Microbulbifer thermotolerans]MCX2836461.1 hypothetical protein [Microbulbifer thermotolerans]SFC54021.1 hypothetical protein SAMN05660479_01889 [Microbulbifer thermotolerans]